MKYQIGLYSFPAESPQYLEIDLYNKICVYFVLWVQNKSGNKEMVDKDTVF